VVASSADGASAMSEAHALHPDLVTDITGSDEKDERCGASLPDRSQQEGPPCAYA
jgi:type IV secretory pathway VirJ component